jgi:hypothetical protein
MMRPVPRAKLRLLVPAVALVAVLAAGAGVWIVARAPVGGAPVVVPVPVPVQPAAAPVDFPLADEAAILAAPAPEMLVFRFRDAPSVLVLSFPSLAQQGDMLDRVAAFVEKAGLPRDRVLADADLDAAIRQAGETRESYYYGHDYRAADLARFFATADRDGIALDAEEVRLRALLTRAGMLRDGAVGALISIPPVVEAQQIDATSRATILHHELSHGVYFTDAAYAAYARAFWQTALSDAQRAGFRRFLGSEGYDTANEDLMLNEAQAYLIHTPDRRYFLPDRAGLTEAEAARLRAVFVGGMADGWLKDAAIRTQ